MLTMKKLVVAIKFAIASGLPWKKETEKKELNEKNVLEYLRRCEVAYSSDIAKEFNVTTSAAAAFMKLLHQNGKIGCNRQDGKKLIWRAL